MADSSTRNVFRLFTAMGLIGLTCVGCDSATKSVSTGGSSAGTTAAAPADPEKKPEAKNKAEAKALPPAPFLKGWEKPALALVLSGEQHGYLEPCGCSETQSGGVARRDDLIQKLTEGRGWDVIGLDLGGTLRRSRLQDQIKFDKLFEAFRQMNYKSVGVGLEELKLGADFILSRMPDLQNPEEVASKPVLVSSNVILFDQADLGWPIPYQIIEKAGVKIGVTSIFGPSLRDKIAPQGVDTNIKIKDPDEVLPGVIKTMEEQKPNFLVLLCHGSDDEAHKYAKAYPQFQIVLAAGGYEEPDGKPEEIGKSLLLHVGHKGKRVGVLGYYPDNADHPFKFELIQLDKDRFQNHPAMRQLMRDYQQQLIDSNAEIWNEILLNQHPSGQTFVGAEKCGECHTKAFAQWKTTGHAVAFTTLKEGPWHENRAEEKIDWIQRQFDPECLSCHVTGWHPQEMLRYKSGFVSEKETPHLVGQQCENCHGPGSLHAERETGSATEDEKLAARKMVKRTLEDAKRHMCIECHDSDNSPKFTPDRFDEFWDQVKHPGKD